MACFYILFNQNTEQDTFAIGFYKIDRNYINEESMLNYWPASQDCWNIDFLKVDINSERSKALVCLILSNGKNNCFIYNIYASGFNMDYLDCNNKICRNEYYGLKINYYSFKDEFIFSCLGEIGNITYCIFNNKFDYNGINQFEKCDKINGYSTLFSNLTNKYYIISDEVCNNKIIPHHHLNETIKVIEEEEREEEEKEEEEEEIKNENEVEEEVTEEIIDYKCKLKKCEICDKNSEKKNLCKKCNLSDKYYPIKISSSLSFELNDYIDCFNETTKPSNFYLNNNYYEPCFERCATCQHGGNGINNNCTSCAIGFILEQDSTDLKNCVIKCQYFYYYT